MRNTKNEAFIASLPISAKALSDKTGVSIRFEAQACPHTDGSGITLPVLREDADIGNRDAFLGYLIHECGHVKFTDFKVLPRSQRLMSATNAIEDLRIEDAMCAVYPGAAFNLCRANQEALANFEQSLPSFSPESAFFLDCMLYVKTSLLKGFTALEPMFDTVHQHLIDNGYAKTLDKAKALIDRDYPKMDSTAKAMELAKKLLKLIGSEEEKREEQQQSDQNGQSDQDSGESQSQDQQNQGQGGGANQNPDQGEDRKSDKDQTKSDAQNVSDDSNSGKSGKGKDGKREKKASAFEKRDSKPLDNPLDMSKKMQEIASEGEDKDAPCGVDRTGGSKAGDGYAETMADRALRSDKLRSEADRLRTEAGKCTAGLTRGLRGLIQTQSMEKSRVGYTGKKLSYPNLSRLATWDLRVFQSSGVRKSNRTIVHILMDRSGSMNFASLRLAEISSLALYDAVDKIPQAKAQLSVFPGTDSSRETVIPLGQNSRRFTPALVGVRPSGGTPFVAAVEEVRLMLKQQDADRKVLLVLTDGGIDGGRSQYETLRARLVRDGVEFGAIGINQSGELKEFFGKNFTEVNFSTELPQAVLTLAKSMLLKKTAA